MAHDYSIIEFFPDRSASNCGYCSGTNCSVSTGMWAHVMTVEDYQDLINRNWRRSGKYCYHPNMKETCCPPYMIKCDTKNFRLGKHHKKLIKKFNRYLMTGQLNVTETEAAADQPAKVSAKPSQSKHGSTQSSQSGDGKIPPKHVKKGVGADPTKPKAVKAKQLRLQKKLKSEMAESSSSAQSESSSAHQSREKGLADLLEEYDSAVAKHKFELRLVRSHPPSKEFEDSQLEEYEVYKKYQMTVHKDPESKVTFSQFKNFLISSPLVEETRHGVELGSFHYQYILDGKIIAVEVMDILPQFISSKYFFYDPAYDFLTLGTYSTLRSIYFIQQLSQKLPSIQHYLMGFYIHSCLKMKYKAKFSPSYLLCPETYLWVPIEQCLPKLDVSKYSRLCDDSAKVDAEAPSSNDHKLTYCLYSRQIVPYGILSARQGRRADQEEVKMYTDLIGCRLNQRLLMYREM